MQIANLQLNLASFQQVSPEKLPIRPGIISFSQLRARAQRQINEVNKGYRGLLSPDIPDNADTNNLSINPEIIVVGLSEDQRELGGD